MNIMDKFKAIQTADTFSQMTTGDKLQATLAVIIYGMVITFAALLILWFMTSLMSYIVTALEKSGGKVKKEDLEKIKAGQPSENRTDQSMNQSGEENEKRLVAVITAAIAASLETSSDQIVVTKIKRISDPTPTWGVAGRQDVMHSRR